MIDSMAEEVIILRKYSDNKKENNKKYNFQGKYGRSTRCFDLDHIWLEENFGTCEPDIYKSFIKTN